MMKKLIIATLLLNGGLVLGGGVDYEGSLQIKNRVGQGAEKILGFECGGSYGKIAYIYMDEGDASNAIEYWERTHWGDSDNYPTGSRVLETDRLGEVKLKIYRGYRVWISLPFSETVADVKSDAGNLYKLDVGGEQFSFRIPTDFGEKIDVICDL